MLDRNACKAQELDEVQQSTLDGCHSAIDGQKEEQEMHKEL